MYSWEVSICEEDLRKLAMEFRTSASEIRNDLVRLRTLVGREIGATFNFPGNVLGKC